MSFLTISSYYCAAQDHQPAHLAPAPIFSPYSAGRQACGVVQRLRFGSSGTVVTYSGFWTVGSESSI